MYGEKDLMEVCRLVMTIQILVWKLIRLLGVLVDVVLFCIDDQHGFSC